MHRYLPLFLCFFLISIQVQAQDPQFSQFYASPTYASPAFAGSDHNTRFVLNYRKQWPNLSEATYTTYNFSVDTYFERIRSGFGLLFTRDVATAGKFTSMDIGLQYAYELYLNDSWTVRAGMQGSYVMRSTEFAGLTFGDQYNPATNTFSGATSEVLAGTQFNYFNLSAGLLAYNDRSWVAFSAHNLTRPNQSFIDGGTDRLPMRFTVQLGTKIYFGEEPSRWRDQLRGLTREISLTPAALVKVQGGATQLDLGMYFTYAPLVLGVWYRGIPVIITPDPTIFNHDAVIGLVGFKTANLSIGYSYDFTVSKLNNGRTGGSHEISIIYNLVPKQRYGVKRQARPGLPCPDF